MIIDAIYMGGYGIYVWSAFIFAFVCCLYLYLKTKKEQLKIQIKEARKNKKEKKDALHILKKELAVHENDLKEKDKKRREILDILGYTRETMEMIHELINHRELLKELKPEQQSVGKELSELKDLLIAKENEIKHI